MGKTCRLIFTGVIIGLLGALPLKAQQDTTALSTDTLKVIRSASPELPANATLDINAPAKAAFYSAVLPGLGQAYNKQYWKIPLVYLLIGGGVYLYLENQNNYLKYRNAYQNRLLGFPDEFPLFPTEILVEAQSYYRRNRDLALMGTLLMYVLNIIDANVSAHLRLWNINDDLSWQIVPPESFKTGWRLRLTYKF